MIVSAQCVMGNTGSLRKKSCAHEEYLTFFQTKEINTRKFQQCFLVKRRTSTSDLRFSNNLWKLFYFGWFLSVGHSTGKRGAMARYVEKLLWSNRNECSCFWEKQKSSGCVLLTMVYRFLESDAKSLYWRFSLLSGGVGVLAESATLTTCLQS